MIGRLIVAIAAFAATTVLARASDEQRTLTVQRDCPAKGWHRACLPIDFFFKEDGSGRLRTKRIDDESWSEMLDYILVKGSLLEGRGHGVFRLKLDHPISESSADSPNELGSFAFVGRSRTGAPIVLTDQGPLEIATPGIVFETPSELYVVREKTGRLVTQLVGPYAMPFVVTHAGEIGIWDSTRAICIAAPSQQTQDLAIVTTACKAAGIPAKGTLVTGNIEEATDIDAQTALTLIGQPDAAGIKVFRVRNAGLLLIWVNWQYCC